MCGIIGIVGIENASELVKQGLALMKNRGSDGAGIFQNNIVRTAQYLEDIPIVPSNMSLGHTLHAIVGHVPQPVNSQGILVANTEIYNWKDLEPKAQNDAQALAWRLDKSKESALEDLDGVYAFAYYDEEDSLILARDILGVKPLWYSSTTDTFAFASERKVLLQLGFEHVQELNPRTILRVNTKTLEVSFTNRPFFEVDHDKTLKSQEEVMPKTLDLLTKAVLKRVPEQEFGLLFSGGIDSTIIAKILYDNGHRVPCYNVSVKGVVSKDALSSAAVAKDLGLDLRKIELSKTAIEEIIPSVSKLIEDSNVVKVGVATTFFKACEQAQKDGLKVLFSGLGSEEIFAGYQRHTNAANINEECLAGLRKMYERDLYRDDVITMENKIELRLPFLDSKLAEYALTIDSTLKIKDTHSKWILRKCAEQLKIPDEHTWRKKSAAQYGSGVDKIITKLAKRSKLTKSQYLRQFYAPANVKLGVLFSGGKDSTYAAHIMKEQNYELTCLLTMKSKNDASYMFHTPAIDVTKVQAEAMDIPILYQNTAGEKEAELEDLEALFQKAKDTYRIEGIVTGALFSTYQRNRIEKICDKLGLKIFAPLWHKPQEQEMRELFAKNYKFIFSSVAADRLDASWVNRIITSEDFEVLLQLQKEMGLNVAGEGGEFESLILDCPLFRYPIAVEGKVVIESEHCAHLDVTNAKVIKEPTNQ